MVQTIRLFMLVEAVAFGLASMIHSGLFIGGYEHPQARIAEGVIATVLVAGLALTFVNRDWTRPVGLAAQGFALLGTLVGLFTVAIGIGPQTTPDLIYHVGILLLLMWGLAVAARSRPSLAG